MANLVRPMYSAIEKKLAEALRPIQLKIIDESHLHAGHSGNPTGASDAESHFRVEVVSDEFTGKSMVQRHRMVYSTLDAEMKEHIHALALKTKTPEEIEAKKASKH
eukprot:CAMPEP_0196585640 /NCGR_PEP_ID=MMETSP1081-20130531/51457_1 /TAXON_ID=36882 /ORGANISM="Pyramimonas amylifera, Strain CCMP720" /LENGTH=105 /DNA_ID=CAMNT_0041907255 /DNA_START=114 /DNA_END=431 /DNA_ORIENTATION=+